jgi:hypothetical protein
LGQLERNIFYSPARKSEHQWAHFQPFTGVHADGYADFDGLLETGRIVEAGCWARSAASCSMSIAATASPMAGIDLLTG